MRTAGPVLIACDGLPVHDALFNAARLASEALMTSVQVLGVCEPIPIALTDFEAVPVTPELDEMRRVEMFDQVRRAVSIASTGDSSWPVDVQLGSPARTIAAQAAQRGASVIVMGIGRHNPLDRLIGAEVTLATLRESHVPVLAVGATFSIFPRHAIVGIDFSATSLRAAEMALKLVGAHGRLTLVHVRPQFDHPAGDWETWDAEYGSTLPPLFENIRVQLNAPESVMVETVTVRGEPTASLLEYAQQSNADVIAVGTQRHTGSERKIVGRVTTRLLRASKCAVLAAPAPMIPGALGIAPEGLSESRCGEPESWPHLLQQFSKRNMGRATRLALDDSNAGSVTEERGYMLDGASYDRRDQRVQLMFAHPTSDAHLTHTQSSVQCIVVLSNADGADCALKVEHARGIMLLTFKDD